MTLQENCNIQCALKAGLAIAIPFVGAGLSAGSVAKESKAWFETLKKPTWTPPDGSACFHWTLAYGAMGSASYLVWRDGGGFSGNARTALALYGTTLVLNWAWAPIFFGKRHLKLSLIDSVLQTGTACASALLFYQINHKAGYLMATTCVWFAFCIALNYRFYKDNKDEQKSV